MSHPTPGRPGRELRTGPILRMSRLSIAQAFVAAVVVSGCATAGGGAASPASTEPVATAGAPLSSSEIEALYAARIAESRTQFSEADARFMTDMIHHHAQALEMSRRAPSQGASPAVRTLAARIMNAQRDEIATMQQWLRDRDLPAPELHETPGGVMVHGGGHAGHGAGDHASMPGMLTPEQLEGLGQVRDTAFDRRFLELMIQHHRGAVVMVRELFATDGAVRDEEVFRFASDVHVDQVTEVARMEQMLEALPPSSSENRP
jgi:uncharacterized protein (DUF305 family)